MKQDDFDNLLEQYKMRCKNVQFSSTAAFKAEFFRRAARRSPNRRGWRLLRGRESRAPAGRKKATERGEEV